MLALADLRSSRTLKLLLGTPRVHAPEKTTAVATLSHFGADAFRFVDETRRRFPELAAEDWLTKWGQPTKYVQVPWVTVFQSTEDPSLVLVGIRSIEIGRPDHGMDQDFDVLPLDGTDPRHHTGIAKWMLEYMTSTGAVRGISELSHLAAKGGLGGLDEKGHIRDHHSTGAPTGDPLADLYVAEGFEFAGWRRKRDAE